MDVWAVVGFCSTDTPGTPILCKIYNDHAQVQVTAVSGLVEQETVKNWIIANRWMHTNWYLFDSRQLSLLA